MSNVILVFGYHDREAPRHWNICRELRAQGYEIRECHTSAKGFLGKCTDLWQQFRAQCSGVATVLVTFPGHYLVPFAWILTRFPRRKLLFDAFISLHDTIVDDRKLISRWNPYAAFLFFVDCISCHLADEVLIDTETHRQFFGRRFHLNPKKIRVISLGTRSDLFLSRRKDHQRSTKDSFDVLFYGTYIPLQGVDVIIDAARILEKDHPEIHFTLVGTGQTYEAMRARGGGLSHITFRDRVPYPALPDLIRSSDLCLGIFGTTPKAARVIPHKVYDAVACSVPVVTADSPAIREKFSSHPLVTLCKAGDPAALAKCIVDASRSSFLE